MTTSPAMTVTDELLAELDRSVRVVWRDDDAAAIAVDTLTAELRRLRSENSELAKDAGRYQWLRDVGELTSDQFGAINEWLWGDGDFTYIARAIDTAMAAQ